MQQAAEMSVAAPTIEASLDGRFISGLKDERVKAAKYYEQRGLKAPSQLVRAHTGLGFRFKAVYQHANVSMPMSAWHSACRHCQLCLCHVPCPAHYRFSSEDSVRVHTSVLHWPSAYPIWHCINMALLH